MTDSIEKAAVYFGDVPIRSRASNYPADILKKIATQIKGREKRALGDYFGLANFGVNLTRLEPGAASALLHAHTKQDELVFILEGTPTLQTREGSTQLAPGMCAGFKSGSGIAHRLLNETQKDVVYLEVGDRTSGDEVNYPNDDMQGLLEDGQWTFLHKNGVPY